MTKKRFLPSSRPAPLPLLLLSLSVVAGGTLVSPAIGSAGAAAADSCGNGGAIVVAGTNAPRNTSGLPTGGVTGVGKRYNSQGYEVQYVNYPTSLWPLGSISYDDDVAIGKAATERAISDYQARCPGKPVVVSGYSQGARIVGDVVSDTANGRKQGSVVSAEGLSAELYSDPRRVGRPNSSGVENALIGIMPGMTMSGPRDGGFGDIPVKQVCNQGDGVCDAPDPFYDPIGAADALAGYFLKHGYYPGRMRHDPESTDKWGDLQCETQGATEDCLTPQPSATTMLAAIEAAQTGGESTIMAKLADRVENRTAMDLAPGVPLSKLRPLIGGGPDSAAGNMKIGAEVIVAGVVGVDFERTWGQSNGLTLGLDLGIGMTADPAVDNALIKDTRLIATEVTIPMIDSRRLLAIALDQTQALNLGTPAPPSISIQILPPPRTGNEKKEKQPAPAAPVTPAPIEPTVAPEVTKAPAPVKSKDSVKAGSKLVTA